MRAFEFHILLISKKSIAGHKLDLEQKTLFNFKHGQDDIIDQKPVTSLSLYMCMCTSVCACMSERVIEPGEEENVKHKLRSSLLISVVYYQLRQES